MTSHPLAGVDFRDTSEHFHLTGTHFVLHPQLISMNNCYQTTFRPSVPLIMIVCMICNYILVFVSSLYGAKWDNYVGSL